MYFVAHCGKQYPKTGVILRICDKWKSLRDHQLQFIKWNVCLKK